MKYWFFVLGATLVLFVGISSSLAATPPKPSFEIYGFVKVDVVYDFKRVLPAWNSVMRPSQIIIHGSDTPFYDEGEFIFSMKPTRLGTNFNLPGENHDISGQLEVDFFGTGSNAGQQLPRLRQAYVRYGSFLAGQTWSLFNDTGVWPITMDFWGPCGVLASRRPQLRWTVVDEEKRFFALALEQPGAGVDAGKGPQYDPELDVRPRSVIPDLTAQYKISDSFGYVQLSGVARELGYEGSFDFGDGFSDLVQGDLDGSVFGWGMYLSGLLKTAERNGVHWSVAYGEGIANYANDGGFDVGPGSDLRAEALPFLLWHVSYDHYWNQRWSTSLSASQALQDNSDGQLDTEFKTGTYTHINLVYHPQAGLSYGLEFLWGELEEKGGASNDDYRLQFSSRLGF